MEVRLGVPEARPDLFESGELAIVTNWGNCVKGCGEPFCPKDGRVLETHDGLGGSDPLLDRRVIVHRDGSELVVCGYQSLDGREEYTSSELRQLAEILERTIRLSLGA